MKEKLLNTIHLREHDASFARGVLSEKNYERGKRRCFVSLRMCIISWLIEIFGSLCHVLYILLMNHVGNFGIQYIEAITMFIVIPFVHLMNDEETKGIIADEGLYAGLKYMLGLKKEPKKSN